VKIESIVIHEIEKKDGLTGAVSYITDEYLDNYAYTNIVEKLDRSFLTIKKIPKMVLSRCEWAHDDYSLNVENLPQAEREPEQKDLLGDVDD